jgi:hypothetical protein
VAVGKFEYLSHTAVVLRGSQGIALMSFGITSAPSVMITEMKPNGAFYWPAQTGGSSWALSAQDVIAGNAVGDFDGDGFDSLVMTSPGGIAILGESISWPAFRAQAMANYGCGPDGCHGGLLGDWLTKPNDLVVTAVKADSGATYLMLRD